MSMSVSASTRPFSTPTPSPTPSSTSERQARLIPQSNSTPPPVTGRGTAPTATQNAIPSPVRHTVVAESKTSLPQDIKTLVDKFGLYFTYYSKSVNSSSPYIHICRNPDHAGLGTIILKETECEINKGGQYPEAALPVLDFIVAELKNKHPQAVCDLLTPRVRYPNPARSK